MPAGLLVGLLLLGTGTNPWGGRVRVPIFPETCVIQATFQSPPLGLCGDREALSQPGLCPPTVDVMPHGSGGVSAWQLHRTPGPPGGHGLPWITGTWPWGCYRKAPHSLPSQISLGVWRPADVCSGNTPSPYPPSPGNDLRQPLSK